MSKFFKTLCIHLGIKHLTATVYHQQTNGQLERYNNTSVSRLRRSVASQQRDWDLFVQPLTYVYNAQVRRLTSFTPFSLLLSRHPPGPAMFDAPSALPTNAYHERHLQMLQTQLINQIQALQTLVNDRLGTAQSRYVWNHDANIRRVRTFTPKEMIFIDRPLLSATISRNNELLTLSSHNKLMLQSPEPFCVVSVTQHTLHIDINEIHSTVTIN